MTKKVDHDSWMFHDDGALPQLSTCVTIHPQDSADDGATRVLAFNHGYPREILLDDNEVAAIRQDIQSVRAYAFTMRPLQSLIRPIGIR